MNKKRFLAFLLSLVMLSGMLPTTGAVATEAGQQVTVSYTGLKRIEYDEEAEENRVKVARDVTETWTSGIAQTLFSGVDSRDYDYFEDDVYYSLWYWRDDTGRYYAKNAYVSFTRDTTLTAVYQTSSDVEIQLHESLSVQIKSGDTVLTGNQTLNATIGDTVTLTAEAVQNKGDYDYLPDFCADEYVWQYTCFEAGQMHSKEHTGNTLTLTTDKYKVYQIYVQAKDKLLDVNPGDFAQVVFSGGLKVTLGDLPVALNDGVTYTARNGDAVVNLTVAADDNETVQNSITSYVWKQTNASGEVIYADMQTVNLAEKTAGSYTYTLCLKERDAYTDLGSVRVDVVDDEHHLVLNGVIENPTVPYGSGEKRDDNGYGYNLVSFSNTIAIGYIGSAENVSMVEIAMANGAETPESDPTSVKLPFEGTAMVEYVFPAPGEYTLTLLDSDSTPLAEHTVTAFGVDVTFVKYNDEAHDYSPENTDWSSMTITNAVPNSVVRMPEMLNSSNPLKEQQTWHIVGSSTQAMTGYAFTEGEDETFYIQVGEVDVQVEPIWSDYNPLSFVTVFVGESVTALANYEYKGINVEEAGTAELAIDEGLTKANATVTVNGDQLSDGENGKYSFEYELDTQYTITVSAGEVSYTAYVTFLTSGEDTPADSVLLVYADNREIYSGKGNCVYDENSNTYFHHGHNGTLPDGYKPKWTATPVDEDGNFLDGPVEVNPRDLAWCVGGYENSVDNYVEYILIQEAVGNENESEYRNHQVWMLTLTAVNPETGDEYDDKVEIIVTFGPINDDEPDTSWIVKVDTTVTSQAVKVVEDDEALVSGKADDTATLTLNENLGGELTVWSETEEEVELIDNTFSYELDTPYTITVTDSETETTYIATVTFKTVVKGQDGVPFVYVENGILPDTAIYSGSNTILQAYGEDLAELTPIGGLDDEEPVLGAAVEYSVMANGAEVSLTTEDIEYGGECAFDTNGSTVYTITVTYKKDGTLTAYSANLIQTEAFPLINDYSMAGSYTEVASEEDTGTATLWGEKWTFTEVTCDGEDVSLEENTFEYEAEKTYTITMVYTINDDEYVCSREVYFYVPTHFATVTDYDNADSDYCDDFPELPLELTHNGRSEFYVTEPGTVYLKMEESLGITEVSIAADYYEEEPELKKEEEGYSFKFCTSDASNTYTIYAIAEDGDGNLKTYMHRLNFNLPESDEDDGEESGDHFVMVETDSDYVYLVQSETVTTVAYDSRYAELNWNTDSLGTLDSCSVVDEEDVEVSFIEAREWGGDNAFEYEPDVVYCISATFDGEDYYGWIIFTSSGSDEPEHTQFTVIATDEDELYEEVAISVPNPLVRKPDAKNVTLTVTSEHADYDTENLRWALGVDEEEDIIWSDDNTMTFIEKEIGLYPYSFYNVVEGEEPYHIGTITVRVAPEVKVTVDGEEYTNWSVYDYYDSGKSYTIKAEVIDYDGPVTYNWTIIEEPDEKRSATDETVTTAEIVPDGRYNYALIVQTDDESNVTLFEGEVRIRGIVPYRMQITDSDDNVYPALKFNWLKLYTNDTYPDFTAGFQKGVFPVVDDEGNMAVYNWSVSALDEYGDPTGEVRTFTDQECITAADIRGNGTPTEDEMYVVELGLINSKEPGMATGGVLTDNYRARLNLEFRASERPYVSLVRVMDDGSCEAFEEGYLNDYHAANKIQVEKGETFKVKFDTNADSSSLENVSFTLWKAGEDGTPTLDLRNDLTLDDDGVTFSYTPNEPGTWRIGVVGDYEFGIFDYFVWFEVPSEDAVDPEPDPEPETSGVKFTVNGTDYSNGETVNVAPETQVNVSAVGFGEAENFSITYMVDNQQKEAVNGVLELSFSEEGTHTISATATDPTAIAAFTMRNADGSYTASITLNVKNESSSDEPANGDSENVLVDPNADDYADSQIDVTGILRSNNEVNEPIHYSVEIAWGAMAFQWEYTTTVTHTWDSTTHTTTETSVDNWDEGKWTLVNNEMLNLAEGAKTIFQNANQSYVVVFNHSNEAVDVDITNTAETVNHSVNASLTAVNAGVTATAPTDAKHSFTLARGIENKIYDSDTGAAVQVALSGIPARTISTDTNNPSVVAKLTVTISRVN